MSPEPNSQTRIINVQHQRHHTAYMKGDTVIKMMPQFRADWMIQSIMKTV